MIMSCTCACTKRKMVPRVDARPPMGDAVFSRSTFTWAGVSSDVRAADPGSVAAAAAMPGSRFGLKNERDFIEL